MGHAMNLDSTLTPQFLEAYDNALACAVSTWTLPDGTAQKVFFNAAQSAAATCPDGLVFYYTVPAGMFPAISQAEADAIATSYAQEQAMNHIICIGNIPNTGTVGVPYSAVIVADGISLAMPPLFDTWALIAGGLPPGLTLNNGGFINGVDQIQGGLCPINGTPTADGIYQFTLRITDPVGDMMQKTFTITVRDTNPNAIQDSQGFDLRDSQGNVLTDSF